MKIAWATDIHLDSVGDVQEKLEELRQASLFSERVIISGDITVAPLLVDHLQRLDNTFEKPVYFVLGNHDYYFSDIMTTRRSVAGMCRSMAYMRYLATTPYVKLTPDVALLGHDGWYDAMNGDPRNEDVVMNDWLKIRDFSTAIRSSFSGKVLDKNVIISIARAICKASVAHIVDGIKAAIRDKNKHVIVVTHVPPFKESYNSDKHRGLNVSSALPWYTSKMMGDALFAAAKAYPQIKFTILSGHAHSHYDEYLLNNLNVRVGKSMYGSPQLAGFIDI